MSRRTFSSTPAPDPYFDRRTLDSLCVVGVRRIEEVLAALGVRLRRRGNLYQGKCPVHGGDNPGAFRFYLEGTHALQTGNWACQTHKCHHVFPGNLIGFTRGVLSRRDCDWEQKGNRTASHHQAVDFLCGVLGTPLDKIHRVKVPVAAPIVAHATGEPPPQDLSDFVGMLRIPSPYYVARGYSPATLKAFRVGEFLDGKYRGRVAYPVMTERGDKVAGFVTRSKLPLCERCRMCHAAFAACEGGRIRYFTGPEGFVDKRHLYLGEGAREEVRRTGDLILVEGAGEVWRLYEAGIRNVAGLFGSNLHDSQQMAVERLVPRRLIVVGDNDEAGRKLAAIVREKVSHIPVVGVLPPTGFKDVGAMPTEEVAAWSRSSW